MIVTADGAKDTVRVWDRNQAKRTATKETVNGVPDAQFSPDEKFVVFAVGSSFAL
jgi:hypothetical protein